MRDNDLDALLSGALKRDARRPDYLDTRLRGELALARKAGRGISLWWLPLVMTIATCLPVFLLGALMPWPASMVFQVAAAAGVAVAAVFTAVGLACFDLREKGRVLL